MAPKKKLKAEKGQVGLLEFLKKTKLTANIDLDEPIEIDDSPSVDVDVDSKQEGRETGNSAVVDEPGKASIVGYKQEGNIDEPSSSGMASTRKICDCWFKTYPWLLVKDGILFCRSCTDDKLTSNSFTKGCSRTFVLLKKKTRTFVL